VPVSINSRFAAVLRFAGALVLPVVRFVAVLLFLDGYRAIAFKSGGKLHIRSRNDNDFTVRYPSILKGLAKLPDETVIDGELVAFDADGKPSFNALQNLASADTPIIYYVFDVLVAARRDVRGRRSRSGESCSSAAYCPSSESPFGILATLTPSSQT
jgi:hypothetical protein